MLTSKEWKQLLELINDFNNQFNWRTGQVWFNALYQIKPDIANEIRGTTTDPFYTDDNLDKFFAYLAGVK